MVIWFLISSTSYTVIGNTGDNVFPQENDHMTGGRSGQLRDSVRSSYD